MSIVATSERIRDHLTKQRARSVFGTMQSCRYRGSEGLMCAVGCLIADEAYTSECEQKLSDDFVVKAMLKASGVEDSLDMDRLLRSWQEYHDGTSTHSKAMSYGVWVANQSPAISPTAFHNLIIEVIQSDEI